jgi:ABC-2 type transport system permease protein
MRYFRETIAVTERILIELFRRRRSLIFWAIFPISILFLNGYILAERANLSLANAMEYSAPSSLVGAALFFSCVGGSVSTVVSEREQKTIKRLFISPLTGISYFLGIFFAHSFIGIGQSILVYTLATFLGAKFSGSIVLGLVVIIFTIIGYVGVGFILGTQLAKRTEDVNALIATFGVPLLILGGAFLPSSLFPDNLVKIANFNPIFHSNEALVAVWAKGENLTGITHHFSFLLIFSVLMLICGWLSYQRMLIIEKRL